MTTGRSCEDRSDMADVHTETGLSGTGIHGLCLKAVGNKMVA